MATFDEGRASVQPTNEPNWLGWSKPISAITPDKSAGIALQTIGKGIEGATEVAGRAVESQSQSEAESLLSSHVENLEDIGSKMGVGVPKDPSQPPPPPVVAQAGAQAQTLESARANGSVSPTYYYGQLDKLTSDLRSRFPMFRDQIDKGVAKATGVHNTANEYAQSLQRDINSFLTNKDQAKNEAMSALKSAVERGEAGASRIWSGVASGKIAPDQGMDWLNNTMRHKSQFELENEQYTSWSHNKERMTDAVKSTYVQRAHQLVGEVADGIAAEMGLHSADELMDAVNHPERYQGKREELNALAASVARIKPLAEARLEREFSQVPSIQTGTDPKSGLPIKSKIDPKTGQAWPTPIQLLGDEYTKIKQQALSRIDTQVAHIKDGEIGSLVYLNKQDKVLQDQVTSDVLKTELGKASMIAKAAKDAGAPQELLNTLSTEIMKVETPDRIKAMVQTMLTKSLLNPGEAAAAGAKSTSMDKDIKTLYSNNVRDPAMIRKFAEHVGIITDPRVSDNVKYEKILYSFGPNNAGVLSNWSRNGLDPVTGNVTEGKDRADIFALMTSKGITDEVRRLDQNPKYHGIWDTYKSTATQMSDNLIGPYIRDMNHLQYNQDQIVYNDKTHQFDFYTTPAQRQMMGGKTPQERLLDKVNIGLARMADIAKAEDKDPDAYILTSMRAMGYDLNEKTAKSFPEAMVSAIMATKAGEKAAYEKGVQKIKDMMNPNKERP